MNKIYYYKQEVKIGDKVDLNGHTVTVTEQLVKDLPDKFKVKNEPNFHELLEEAKRRYPKGTKFKNPLTGKVCIASGTYGVWPYISNSIENIDGEGLPYRNGQWAEIIKPLFTTEDGVEIFKGDTFYSIVNDAIYLLNTCQYSESCDFKRFSTRKAAEEYITKHKEKTLEDYESELLDGIYNTYHWLKEYHPKAYYSIVLQLIADDLNGGWKPKVNIFKSFIKLKTNQLYETVTQGIKGSSGSIYFKSEYTAAKALKIMGDKLDYIYKS